MNSEGAFIAGKPNNEKFNSELSQYLENIIQTGEHPTIQETDDLWFYIDDSHWIKEFPNIFTSRTPFKVGRKLYTIKLPAKDYAVYLPKTHILQPVNNSLELNSLSFPEDVWEWVKDSIIDFLDRGFGVVLSQDGRVISWSTADCWSGDRCEIGIITTSEERRKGFGSLTVLGALDYCYQSEFKTVGWHSEAHNWGSISTAEKVGFKKTKEYYAWVCKFNLEQHNKEKAIVEKYYP